MRSVVLSIGSELLRGDIVDTNAAFLTRQLSQLGFHVVRSAQYPDDLDALTTAMVTAFGEAEITVCTGGLGPTADDLTRQAIAAALEEEIFYDESLVANIEARFAAMGRRMPHRNRQQGMLIPSADAIPNPNGTAPGWFVRRDGRAIIAMPGPPHEMEPMWEDSVLPHLEGLLSTRTATRSLMTFGLGESAVEERIADVIHRGSDVVVATYAKENGVEVHMTARAGTLEQAEQLANEAETELRRRLGDAIFGTARDTLAVIVCRALESRGSTLAVMESATGGELSSMITDTPGSSRCFIGGVVAYSAKLKAAQGVDEEVIERHGLISAETALAMARAACMQTGANAGLGVTGIAGTEPVEGKPPGTCFVACCLGEREEVREIHRPARRDVAKRFFAQCALDLLRRQLIKEENKNE